VGRPRFQSPIDSVRHQLNLYSHGIAATLLNNKAARKCCLLIHTTINHKTKRHGYYNV